MTKCKNHIWETPMGLVDGVPTKGIRRCTVCGYTPPTQRQPLPKDAEPYKKPTQAFDKPQPKGNGKGGKR